MKKKISSILVIMMSMSLCFGCGNDGDKNQKASESVVTSSVQDDSINESSEESTTESVVESTSDNTSEQETTLVEDITTSKEVAQNETTSMKKEESTTEKQETIKKQETTTKKQETTTKKQETTTAKKQETTTAKNEQVTVCNHSYVDATCKSPAKCSKCGETKGSVSSHNIVINKCTVCDFEMECIASFDVSKNQDKKIMANLYKTEIEGEYKLEIYGKGDMANYEYIDGAPYSALFEKIKYIEIGEGITFIGNYAFSSWGDLDLKELVIPNSVTKIGEHAFERISLPYGYKLELPNSLKTIDSYAFNSISVTSLNIPNSVIEMGNCAFGSSSITNLTMSDNVEKMGENVFEDISNGFLWSVQNTTAYDNGLYIGNESNPYLMLVRAKDKDITTINIHPKTKYIYEWALKDCILIKEVEIPDSVIIICEVAFYGCHNLETVKLPKNLKYMSYAFEYCQKLTYVTLPKSMKCLGKGNFILTNITVLSYEGTVNEWNALEKEEYWDAWGKVFQITIKCSDGEIVHTTTNPK